MEAAVGSPMVDNTSMTVTVTPLTQKGRTEGLRAELVCATRSTGSSTASRTSAPSIGRR